MPIYEYDCQSCRERFSLLILAPSTSAVPICPKCGSDKLERLMSRFGTATSEQKRMERLSDPSSFSGLHENDPAAVARWAKKMGKEMGEDGSEDFNDMVDQAVDEDTRQQAPGNGDELG